MQQGRVPVFATETWSGDFLLKTKADRSHVFSLPSDVFFCKRKKCWQHDLADLDDFGRLGDGLFKKKFCWR